VNQVSYVRQHTKVMLDADERMALEAVGIELDIPMNLVVRRLLRLPHAQLVELVRGAPKKTDGNSGAWRGTRV
jgi:hypothetical protein